MSQTGTLHLDRHSFHELRSGGRRLLFHVPTSALFELDAVGGAVLDLAKAQPALTAPAVREWFEAREAGAPALTVAEVAEALHDLRGLQVLKAAPAAHGPTNLEIREFPLGTLVLNVGTGCNLSCTYCYKEDLAAPAKGRRMSFDTAREGIELLLREGQSRDRLNVVFFGGEPLTNLPLIRQTVEYAEARCAQAGKAVDFSLTTNATLLTEEIVDWLDRHRFGISVSIDGPKAIHDRSRRTVGGAGSYDVVAKKARMLLARCRARPVGARVTLAAGATDVVAIHRHLKDELGFAEVGFAPVTASAQSGFSLAADELRQVFEGMKALGRDYLEQALAGRSNGFSNLQRLLADIGEGRRKALPCGAGVGLLALDGAGELHLCHRFAGSEMPGFGSAAAGIDKARLGRFLEAAAERAGTDCAACRIRNLCAGGCYHESYARFDDPLAPTLHYCDLMREWVDFGIEIYIQLLERNPEFLDRHIRDWRAHP